MSDQHLAELERVQGEINALLSRTESLKDFIEQQRQLGWRMTWVGPDEMVVKVHYVRRLEEDSAVLRALEGGAS